MQWYEALAAFEADGVPHAVATVLATSGSTPRNSGDKMVVAADASYGSIGGGQLERMAAQRAREGLQDASGPLQEIIHYPLAAAAAQCCGGSVTVLIERRCQNVLRTAVFGAGHVGAQVVRLLHDLPAAIVWIDNRPGFFDADLRGKHQLAEDPAATAESLAPDSHALVLTHDHELDFRIVRRLLGGGACRSIGLIGSATKWRRFRARLLRDGLPEAAVDRVRCPVGRSDVPGKQPMAVAIAIVAELLQLHGAREQPDPLTWRQIRSALVREGAPR